MCIRDSIWFSVPVTCICAYVTTLQHILTISSQCAHVFCIQQWSVHLVHYKPTNKLNLVVSLNVWRPCKWFTFPCYVVMCCILTTVLQFSTTSGPHWSVSYTLIKTACVVHYRLTVRWLYFHQSLNGRRACYLIFSAGYMHLCKCNDSAAYCHHLLPMCTRLLYTTVECACGTLQTNRHIKSNCLIWRPCKWFTFQCYVVMSWILTTVRQLSTTSGLHWNVSYTPIKTACVVHYRWAVRSRILSSLTEWQACKLSDFQWRLHAFMQM